jgi:hypothetical protein
MQGDELPSNLYACKCPTRRRYLDNAKSTNAVNDLFAQNVTRQSLYCKEVCVSAKLVDECLFTNADSDHCSTITKSSGRAELWNEVINFPLPFLLVFHCNLLLNLSMLRARLQLEIRLNLGNVQKPYSYLKVIYWAR